MNVLDIAEELIDQSDFFKVEIDGDRQICEGSAHCALGHQIPRGDGELPDGIFVEWHWQDGALTVRNDRYGMYPAFYYCDETSFCISTSIFKLLGLGVPAEIDWPALGVFFRVGSYIGNDTLFRGIRALPPGANLEWKNGQLKLDGGYPSIRRSAPTRDQAVDAYIDLFRTAMKRRVPDHDRLAMPLSGGRDSRHILLELERLGRKPEFCVTGRRFPPDRCEDERIAALLAESVGVEHVLVGPPRRQVESFVRANVKTNMTAPRRGWKFSILERLMQGADVSYDGIGGDMLSGGSALNPKRVEYMQSGRYREFCKFVFRDTEAVLRSYMPDEQVDRMTDEVAMERLLRELPKHADAPNPTTSFYFWNRTRRFDSTNPYGMLRDISVVYSPFLDHDLVDFLLSLDVSFNTGPWFHDAVIAKAYPAYRQIPFEIADSPLTRGAAATLRTTRELAHLCRAVRPRRMLRSSFIWPRLAFRFATFGMSTAGAWFVPQVVYLLMAEDAAFDA